ncbi:hypothetical protein [Tuwongella immobilis]|uniref:Carboxypeptidase regulatory-like domain-containing protein n=1 Tax=Tuwongella immobilis TaxID=692036 RepID=A0A6C2YHQ4_9BACT|nr:hypothetical protein [Tuwongella immobilis]VIP00947.1 unnamed protein product [Tuwongella immobilis]VTR97312.1 unnamed protein product [Tuwongella immobilis]
MSNWNFIRRTLALLLLSGTLLGCSTGGSDKPAPKTVPVKGVVLDKATSKPTAVSGLVTFRLKSDPTILANGRIGDDGSFELSTILDDGKLSGAAVGAHDVTVLPPSGDQLQGKSVNPIPIGVMEVPAAGGELKVLVPSRGKR